jgi:hypothetical protein
MHQACEKTLGLIRMTRVIFENFRLKILPQFYQ